MTHPTLTHHGGATGVTGSCHRLQLAPDRALLVDCGLFQGQDAEPSPPVGASPARERAAGAGEVGCRIQRRFACKARSYTDTPANMYGGEFIFRPNFGREKSIRPLFVQRKRT